MQLLTEMGRSGAFLLQGLVAILMALSISAVWVAFRRRAMAYWAAAWWVLAGAVVMSAMASTDGRPGKLVQSLVGLGLWLAVAPMVHGAAAAAAGRAPTPRVLVGRAVVVAIVGLASALLLLPLLIRVLPADRMALGTVLATHGPVILALLTAAVHVARIAGASPRLSGLRVVAVAIVLLAGRSTLWVAPRAIGADGATRDLLVTVASVLQLVTIVVLGIATLFVVLAEERAAALERERQWNRVERMDALGQMAGGVAHDFANVLMAVEAGLDLARQDATAPPRLAEDLGEVQRASARGRALVTQLLTFARREQGTFEVVDVGGVLVGLRRMLVNLLRPRHDLDFVAPEQPIRVRLDVPRFEQAVINLVTNARDAMANGGMVTLTLERRSVPTPRRIGEVELPGGSYAVISIEDTGVGIPAGDLARIFEPFFSTKPTGTGLGLANVAAGARAAGGAVTASSEVGRGTRVELWYPVAPGAAG